MGHYILDKHYNQTIQDHFGRRKKCFIWFLKICYEYCLSNKSWPILYRKLLFELGRDSRPNTWPILINGIRPDIWPAGYLNFLDIMIKNIFFFKSRSSPFYTSSFCYYLFLFYNFISPRIKIFFLILIFGHLPETPNSVSGPYHVNNIF